MRKGQKIGASLVELRGFLKPKALGAPVHCILVERSGGRNWSDACFRAVKLRGPSDEVNAFHEQSQPLRRAPVLEPLGHSDYRQRQPSCHRNAVSFYHGVTKRSIKRFSRKSGDNFNGAEARLNDLLFAGNHDAAPNPATRPRRMNEEGAHPCRILFGIEQGVFTGAAAVTSIKRASPTPPATANNALALLSNEIRPVAN